MKKINVTEKYNLPEKVEFCTKCTMSNQRPRITFKDGVCSACQYADYKKTVDWQARELELIALCNKHRRNDGRYDVIVPCSGGKDASRVAHELKFKYGMNPLTVTWAPNLYTEIGWQNLRNMTLFGDLPNVLGTPAGGIHRKLTKLFFEILGDPFQPFIYGQTNYPLQVAVQYQIPLIMAGENGEVEYGGDMKNAYSPTRDPIKDHKKHYFSGIEPQDLVNYGIKETDIVPYLSPPAKAMKALKLETHFYGYYTKWVPNENAEYCKAHTGFKPKPTRSESTYSRYASLDDKIDGFHYWLSLMKFGIGRCTADAAHEIRDGYITREKAIEYVHKYDQEFPFDHFKEFLQYCDISQDFFWEVMEMWRNDNLWVKDGRRWKLRNRIEK